MRGKRLAVTSFAVALLLPTSAALAAPETIGPNVTSEGSESATEIPTDKSVRAAPAVVTENVEKGESVTVVVAEQDDVGELTIREQQVRGKSAARAAVAEAQSDQDVKSIEVSQRYQVTASNDQYRSDQWALDGFKAETAVWPITTGAGVRVAVIDSGVQSNHPDLSGRLLSGVDFVADGSGSTPNTTDPLGHGTHVTGIIAAVAGNGIGVAGLAPSVRVIPVRVLDENGAGWSADIAKGIVYAVDAGAHVINLSLGGSRSSVIGSAVTYAHAQGVTVTAAMGNSKQQGNPTSYPAANLESIAVAAASSSGSVASFSNTGDHVDVAAPGVAIKSTVSSGGYATYSGTSMATPYVSALAALMLAKSPGLTPDQVRSVMQGAAKNLGSPGWDTQSGHGLINPSAVLDPDPSSPSLDPDPSSPSLDPDPSSPTPELVAPTQSEEAVDSPVYWVKPKITSEPRNDSAKAGRKVRFRTKFVAQGDVSMTWQFKTVNGKKRKLPGRASVVIQSDRTKIKIVQLKNKWSGAKVQAIVANSSGEARSRWARIKIG